MRLPPEKVSDVEDGDGVSHENEILLGLSPSGDEFQGSNLSKVLLQLQQLLGLDFRGLLCDCPLIALRLCLGVGAARIPCRKAAPDTKSVGTHQQAERWAAPGAHALEVCVRLLGGRHWG